MTSPSLRAWPVQKCCVNTRTLAAIPIFRAANVSNGIPRAAPRASLPAGGGEQPLLEHRDHGLNVGLGEVVVVLVDVDVPDDGGAGPVGADEVAHVHQVEPGDLAPVGVQR